MNEPNEKSRKFESSMPLTSLTRRSTNFIEPPFMDQIETSVGAKFHVALPVPTAKLAAELRRRGIVLLVGSIEFGLVQCARAFPGAIIFNLELQTADSSLHVAMRRVRQPFQAG